MYVLFRWYSVSFVVFLVVIDLCCSPMKNSSGSNWVMGNPFSGCGFCVGFNFSFICHARRLCVWSVMEYIKRATHPCCGGTAVTAAVCGPRSVLAVRHHTAAPMAPQDSGGQCRGHLSGLEQCRPGDPAHAARWGKPQRSVEGPCTELVAKR